MKYNVHQHWDPLKVCIVGKSYPPEFYNYIKNSKVRSVMERIATETEEDYQKLIKLLENFDVDVLRPTVPCDSKDVSLADGKLVQPPMCPRDYSAMIGNDLYFDYSSTLREKWTEVRGNNWPQTPPDDITTLSPTIKSELLSFGVPIYDFYGSLIKQLEPHCNIILNQGINSAMTTRIGRDLYFGTDEYEEDREKTLKLKSKHFSDYRCHVINTGGHADGTYCPVVPGLIVSLTDIPTYKDTFPDWEVIYLPGQSWDSVKPFLELKEKNRGKWWVPGEELNDDFTEFVESWLGHWVGYVEETVFDVNMLVIDEKNVVCNNYNEDVFKAFDQYGITPHVINFRHRYFWDGGLHCITSDLHREGTQKDYFPQRG